MCHLPKLFVPSPRADGLLLRSTGGQQPRNLPVEAKTTPIENTSIYHYLCYILHYDHSVKDVSTFSKGQCKTAHLPHVYSNHNSLVLFPAFYDLYVLLAKVK